MKVKVPFSGGNNEYITGYIDTQRTVNMFPVIVSTITGGKDYTLISYPGKKTVAERSTGGNTRALHSYIFGKKLIVCYANRLFLYDNQYAGTAIDTEGDIQTTNSVMRMAENRQGQVCIVDGVDVFVYKEGASPSFQKITSPTISPPSGVTYHTFTNPKDVTLAYGRMFVADGNRVYGSDVNNALAFNALNFRELEATAGELMGVRYLPRRGEILFFGAVTTEIYTLSNANLLFPFIRKPNLTLAGCEALGSIASNENIVVWMANSAATSGGLGIYAYNGQQKKITRPAQDYRLDRLTDPTDCRAYLIKINGHLQYVLNFLTDDVTIYYDFITKEWFFLESLNRSKYPVISYAWFNNSHIVGEFNNEALKELNTDYVTNDGERIRCQRTSSLIYPENKGYKWKLKRVQLEAEYGIGDTTPSTLNNNYDFSNTFETVDLFASLNYYKTKLPYFSSKSFGEEGDYQRYILWECNLDCNTLVLELVAYASERIYFRSLWAEIELTENY